MVKKNGATFTITKFCIFNTRFSRRCIGLIDFIGSFTLVCDFCACKLVETQNNTDKMDCKRHFNVLQ